MLEYDLLKATEVMPHMMLLWLYTANSWLLPMSKKLHEASSDQDASPLSLGKNCMNKQKKKVQN